VPDTWLGNWKDKSHHYIVLRVDQQGKPFYGWMEVSFDRQAEKIILHRAALCKESAGRSRPACEEQGGERDNRTVS